MLTQNTCSGSRKGFGHFRLRGFVTLAYGPIAALKSDLTFYSLLMPALQIAVTFSEGLSDDVKGCVQDLIARVHM